MREQRVSGTSFVLIFLPLIAQRPQETVQSADGAVRGRGERNRPRRCPSKEKDANFGRITRESTREYNESRIYFFDGLKLIFGLLVFAFLIFARLFFGKVDRNSFCTCSNHFINGHRIALQ